MRAVIVVSASLLLSTAQPADPLAEMRRAIGDEAALQQVMSFSANGSLKTVGGGRTFDTGYEIQCDVPDRFVHTTFQQMNLGPMGNGTTTVRSGFDKDKPIAEVSNNLGLPSPPAFIPAGPAPKTPAEIDADLKRRVLAERAKMVEYTLPLLGRSMAGADLTIRDGADVEVAGRQLHEIDAVRWDGVTLHLFLDRATRLPVRLTWLGRPFVIASSTSEVSMRGGNVVGQDGGRIALPAGDPTAGQPDVEYVLEFSDFKVDNGFNWPHRFVTTIDGKPWSDAKLGKFRIKKRS